MPLFLSIDEYMPITRGKWATVILIIVCTNLNQTITWTKKCITCLTSQTIVINAQVKVELSFEFIFFEFLNQN